MEPRKTATEAAIAEVDACIDSEIRRLMNAPQAQRRRIADAVLSLAPRYPKALDKWVAGEMEPARAANRAGDNIADEIERKSDKNRDEVMDVVDDEFGGDQSIAFSSADAVRLRESREVLAALKTIAAE